PGQISRQALQFVLLPAGTECDTAAHPGPGFDARSTHHTVRTPGSYIRDSCGPPCFRLPRNCQKWLRCLLKEEEAPSAFSSLSICRIHWSRESRKSRHVRSTA